MKGAIVIFSLGVTLCAASTIDFDRIIDEVNSAGSTWTAGRNFPKNVPRHYFRSLVSQAPQSPAITDGVHLRTASSSNESFLGVPKRFDGRKYWKHCPTIKHVPNQGACSSGWAVAVAGAFSDRLCIASDGKFKSKMSAEDILSCCTICGGKGCDGGNSVNAWVYIQGTGIVTGGDYHSHKGCQPYSISPCTKSVEKCAKKAKKATPTCYKECTNSKYKTDFEDDIHKTQVVWWYIEIPARVRHQLFMYGPVAAQFTVYEDFLTYKSGIYEHVTGEELGRQVVRLIGWGVKNGVKYWLAVNSWGKKWGDKGLFKIKMGSNECGIEDVVTFGVYRNQTIV